MGMKHKDVKIKSIGDFISKLDAHRASVSPIWYRGQADIEWTLKPSIAREARNPVDLEMRYLRRFKQDATRLLSSLPTDEWAWLFLMQHYGIPTRLFDWSENPLVALYFAVASEPTKDGTLLVLDPIAFNAGKGLEKFGKSVPCCSLDSELDLYLTSKIIPTQAPNPPVAAIGIRNSSRISAQAGTFLLFHSDFTLDDRSTSTSMWRYIIPSAEKPDIKKELELINVNQFSVFPELDRLANHIKQTEPT